jgi:hypothetical protein
MDKTVGEMLGSLNTLHQREEEEEEEEEEISQGRKKEIHSSSVQEAMV